MASRNIWNNRIWFITLICISISTITVGSLLQSNFGEIDIELVRFADETGDIVEGKLYRPTYATAANPLPGILLMHGFNNDKDTEAPTAIELARRGFVALAISEIGQGDSSPWLALDIYTDTNMGANASYHFLKNLAFVNGDKLGIVGHSMGGSNARKIAAINPDHDAVVIQSGGPANITDSGINNYLQLWCQFEDLNSYTRPDWYEMGMEMITYNTNETAQINHDYGNFNDGSAQRYAYIPSTHPGGTWNMIGIAETIDWMRKSLKGGVTDSHWIDPYNQISQFKEAATLIATITVLLSIIPLTSILLETETFKDIIQPLPTRYTIEERTWWIYATINGLIGGVTFLIIPTIGLLIDTPITNLITASAFFWWFLVNFLIAAVAFYFWFRGAKTKGVTWYDMGVSFDENKKTFNREILKKTIVLAIIIVVYLYGFVAVFEKLTLVEFRFMWPVLRQIQGYRLTQFFIYLVPTLIFFLFNGGVFLFGQIRSKEHSTFTRTHLVWFVKSVYAMMCGLILFFALHYLPLFFLGTAPTFHFIPLAALFQIFLMQAIPQFTFMFFLLTYFYQKTGKIYLGSIVISLIITWILAISGAYSLL
ncbi:MAG: alpha/beta fold hydrolase [Candidatus Heimdallarchaeota archaeon]|nr:alpha/beta fold hydrolase [Candidatus Heimdallarchaeota archaeon]